MRPLLSLSDDDGDGEAPRGIQGPSHSEQVTEDRRTQTELDSPQTSTPHHLGPRRLSPPRLRPPPFLPRWPPHLRKLLLCPNFNLKSSDFSKRNDSDLCHCRWMSLCCRRLSPPAFSRIKILSGLFCISFFGFRFR